MMETRGSAASAINHMGMGPLVFVILFRHDSKTCTDCSMSLIWLHDTAGL
jgi:hypothetical protein